jgi:predicted nucleotidyltransferase
MNNNQILSDLSVTLTKAFPGVIVKVLLFGSYAHGGENDNSDFDVLVITREVPDWRLENAIINECYMIDLQYDIVTDVKIIAESELDTPKGRQPYIQQALAQGLLAHDA